MKTILTLLFVFTSAFGALPKDLLYVAEEKDLVEIVHRLKPLETVWILMPELESFENQVIQEMATSERWQTLRTWHPPAFDEYQKIVSQEGLTILHQEPHRTFLKGATLRKWVESELAPRLGLDLWESKAFADEFLSLYPHDSAISRELLSQLSY